MHHETEAEFSVLPQFIDEFLGLNFENFDHKNL